MVMSLAVLWFLLLFWAIPEQEKAPTAWLQDVDYIISKQDREAFKTLDSPGDRAKFIEEFWLRRDVDPSTERNEFREAYLERVEYAHQEFRPKSDRARVFVLNGEPDQRLMFPAMKFEEVLSGLAGFSGGPATSSPGQGPAGAGTEGGLPSVRIESPEAELWTYYNARGSSMISGPLELIFMRVPPGELSTLFAVPTARDQLNLARMLGGSPLFRGYSTFPVDFTLVYAGRPRFHDVRDFYYQILNQPRTFDMLESNRIATELRRSTGDLEAAGQLRALQQAVQSGVYFGTFEAAIDYWFFRSAEEYVYVPVAIYVTGEQLGMIEELSILAEISDGSKTVAHFTDDIHIREEGFKRIKHEGFQYQSRFAVRPGEYTLEIYLLDRNNSRQSRILRRLTVPDLSGVRFSLSDLVLCSSVVTEAEAKSGKSADSGRDWLAFSDLNPLAAGGYFLKPARNRTFRRKNQLTVFFEVYLPRLRDNLPHVEVAFTLLRDEVEIGQLEAADLRYLTQARLTKISFAKTFSISRLKPGRYQLKVAVRDLIAGEELIKTTTFEVL